MRTADMVVVKQGTRAGQERRAETPGMALYIGPSQSGGCDLRALINTSLSLVYTHPAANMSDGEGHGGMPPNDDDLSLPKATVAKMISGAARTAPLRHSRPVTLFLQSCCPKMSCAQRRRET